MLGALLLCAGAAVAESEGGGDAPDRAAVAATPGGAGVGARVFVVERASGSLAVYDLQRRALVPGRIGGLGDLRHATMVFTPDLRHGFLATRNGKVTRVDLSTLRPTGQVFSSENSIDNAISQDGRLLAVGEYQPGGLSVLDVETLEVVGRLPGTFTRGDQTFTSRVTGVVDAPGNKFVCVLMEGAEIWVVDTSGGEVRVERRIETPHPMPYDAMITPDGRWYLVGHQHSPHVSVLDLRHPERGVRSISLEDPRAEFARSGPVKLPHMASWAVAGDKVFVPLVGEDRLAVLDRESWDFVGSIPLRGHPVYAVRSPTEREVWVSFSGEEDDAFVQVVDTESLTVTRTIEVGARIYHMDFTPRGAHALISANGADRLFLVDANTYQVVDEEALDSPSGVFGVWRAFRIGL